MIVRVEGERIDHQTTDQTKCVFSRLLTPFLLSLSQIDETKEFINTQLNEARNRIIRLSLNIEMCMLGLTFGACFGSIFGMNLMSGLEQDPHAFSVVNESLNKSSIQFKSKTFFLSTGYLGTGMNHFTHSHKWLGPRRIIQGEVSLYR